MTTESFRDWHRARWLGILTGLSMTGLLITLGVLLDTAMVRSLLVPAISYDVGQIIWWPWKLSRQPLNGEIP